MVSVDPTRGPAYQYREIPPNDGVPEPLPFDDPGFAIPEGNPDGSEIGPLYVSPEGQRWIEENVRSKGYFIDWGSREYFDAETGEVKGTIPTHLPRMI